MYANKAPTKVFPKVLPQYCGLENNFFFHFATCLYNIYLHAMAGKMVFPYTPLDANIITMEWFSRFLIGRILRCMGLQSSYRPVSPLMVFLAMTVEGAMPPKLKLQSFICHELEFVRFSNITLMAVFTMAMSSSRRRACLNAKTYSHYKTKKGNLKSS